MSEYDIQAAIDRLHQLGITTDDLQQDYYKIPLENMDLSKVEKEHPTKTKQTSKHTLIIDSRQRNYSIYPNPNCYLIDLVSPYKNVERIELIAAMLPKTEYNINSDNNLLLVSIGGTQEALYLTPGQYIIGSNQTGIPFYQANGSQMLYGLLAELKNILNTHTLAAGGFNTFLATEPSPSDPLTPSFGTGRNASILNRIVITHSTLNFSIDFICENYSSDSPFRVLGFLKRVYTSAPNSVYIYGTDNIGTCTPTNIQSDTPFQITTNALSSEFDYNMMDDPQYIIMNLEFGNRSGDRVESIDIATDGKFAVIIYDANEPDNLATYNSNTNSAQGAQILYERKPGRLKALKGTDFDKKIITFDPPILLDTFKISFTKYDNTPYNFLNREHMLTFEIDVADYDPKYRP
jgi:hypothetical protein